MNVSGSLVRQATYSRELTELDGARYERPLEVVSVEIVCVWGGVTLWGGWAQHRSSDVRALCTSDEAEWRSQHE